MKTLQVLAAVSALALPGVAHAEGLYLKGEAGVGVAGDLEFSGLGEADLETGWQLGGGVGYDFAGPFRVEGEVFYTDNEIDDQGFGLDASISSLGAYATVLADLADGPIRPFVGAGVGIVNGEAEVQVLGVSVTDEDTALGLVARAGVSFDLSENTVVDVGYRFMTAEFEDTDATIHGITAAIRWGQNR